MYRGLQFFNPRVRRGVAGARLFDILKAGEWKSPAFLLYCDMHKLESSAVVEAHLEDSDGE